MRIEEQIILSMSNPEPAPSDIEKVRGAILSHGTAMDYDWIWKSAAQHGVVPLLYKNIKDLPGIPAEFLNRLKKVYLYTAGRNLKSGGEMLRLLDLLKKSGIEVMPLKGAIASRLYFGSQALYPTTDIDILVRPEDLAGAEVAITGAGYSRNDAFDQNDLRSDSYHLLYQKGNYALELHWNLTKRYFSVPPGFWWEEKETAGYEGTEVTLPSPERYLMYTIFRAFDHGFRPLKFFVLIAGQIETYGSKFDWKKFLHFCRFYRMERVAVFTLKLLRDIYGISVPDAVERRSIRGYGLFRRLVLNGIFQEVKRLHLRMFAFTFLLDSRLDFSKVFIRRLFPRMAEIRLRYQVPKDSKKAYAYYALNPILVLMRKK